VVETAWRGSGVLLGMGMRVDVLDGAGVNVIIGVSVGVLEGAGYSSP
jgi:hypothetical protein